MHPNTTKRRIALAGLSFPVSELLTVRAWAARYGVALAVVIDRVIDEAAYEEMLVLTAGHAPDRPCVLWRTGCAVFEQHEGAPPRAYRSLDGALRALVPQLSKPPGSWLTRWLLPTMHGQWE
jgi:hypothetical protein